MSSARSFHPDKVEGPWWSDKPVLIVGTGPSLTGFNFERLRGLGFVLAVKEAVWDLSFADAVFSVDVPWMRRNMDRLSALRMPVYLSIPADEPNIPIVRGAIYLERIRKTETLSTNPSIIECGGNSGFGALNLAFLKKAKRIVLFGFDYRAGHYCQDRYLWQRPHHNASLWPRWAQNFRSTLPQLKGVEILNASPHSTVDAFDKCTLDEAVEHLDRLRSR